MIHHFLGDMSLVCRNISFLWPGDQSADPDSSLGQNASLLGLSLTQVLRRVVRYSPLAPSLQFGEVFAAASYINIRQVCQNQLMSRDKNAWKYTRITYRGYFCHAVDLVVTSKTLGGTSLIPLKLQRG